MPFHALLLPSQFLTCRAGGMVSCCGCRSALLCSACCSRHALYSPLGSSQTLLPGEARHPTAREMGVERRSNLSPCHRAVTQLVIHSGFGEREGLKQGGGQTGDRLPWFQSSSFYCIPWATGFLVFYWTASPGEGWRGEPRGRMNGNQMT